MPIAGMGIFMPFDVTKFPTNDAAVRQAISYFVNRPAVHRDRAAGRVPVS